MRFTVALLISCSLLVTSAIPNAAAGTSRNEVLSISAPSEARLSKSGCTTISVSYKIQPLYRDFPGFIQFSLTLERNHDSDRDGPAYAYDVFNYNFDFNTGGWVSNNADFFGKVPLRFCSTPGQSRTGAKLAGLKRPGIYYLAAYTNFMLDEYSDDLDNSLLTIPIKITRAGKS